MPTHTDIQEIQPIDTRFTINLSTKTPPTKHTEQQHRQALQQKDQDSKTQDSIQSTAMLHPILEDTEIKCPHNGVVKLKSNKGKPFKSKGIPMILESDLINSHIIGCTNNIAGVPTPCTLISVILPSARGLKKFNDDYPIMQDLVSGNVFSDKGFPLIATPKPNTFRINSPKPIDSNTQNKQKLEPQIKLYKPALRLHYKITPLQKDNLPIYRLKLNDSIIESNNDTPLDSITIDIAKDTKDLHDIHNLDKALQDILSILHSNLKQSFMKEYMYKYVSLQLDSNMLLLILLIPQKIPKIYKEAYKEYQDKEYGVGRYTYVYEYCYHKDLDIKDYAKIGLDSNPSNATILTLHTPYKTQKLEIALANGLDSILESKDREQNLDSLLTLKLINGGYKEKYWSFGEGVEEKEIEEEIEEKIDISQGILIASNDDKIAFELLATNPKHQFNCPDVESGSFIQNLRGFSGMLDFLENAIYSAKATLDYDNLKEYESYNTAEYKSNNIYAKNKCLSERIKAIYAKDWLSTLSKDIQEAYNSDIHIFMGQWKETLQENHQNIQSFVASFCKKMGCIGLKIKSINSRDNEMNISISDATIEIRSYSAVSLHNQRVQDRLLFLLRQWYIIFHSQHNSFDVLLRKYMRYIEINIRYFYVYDESDQYFYTQICVNDLQRLREVV